jgi:hypothetical protein
MIIKINGETTDRQFFRCILRERMGEERSKVLQCYRDVAAVAGKALSQSIKSSDPKYTSLYFNLLVINLMAETPEAETMKAEFLSSLKKDQPNAEMYRDILQNSKISDFLLPYNPKSGQ